MRAITITWGIWLFDTNHGDYYCLAARGAPQPVSDTGYCRLLVVFSFAPPIAAILNCLAHTLSITKAYYAREYTHMRDMGV